MPRGYSPVNNSSSTLLMRMYTGKGLDAIQTEAKEKLSFFARIKLSIYGQAHKEGASGIWHNLMVMLCNSVDAQKLEKNIRGSIAILAKKAIANSKQAEAQDLPQALTTSRREAYQSIHLRFQKRKYLTPAAVMKDKNHGLNFEELFMIRINMDSRINYSNDEFIGHAKSVHDAGKKPAKDKVLISFACQAQEFLGLVHGIKGAKTVEDYRRKIFSPDAGVEIFNPKGAGSAFALNEAQQNTIIQYYIDKKENADFLTAVGMNEVKTIMKLR